jgi:cysteine desulfurase
MAANNETGVIQPWREIAGDCRQYSVPIVCDATQWLGKLPSSALGDADFVLGSAHKFGGPKGSGFLVIPEGPSSRGFCALVGGGQQDGHRAGTEDWPSVAALIAALAEADATASTVAISQRQSWRDSFEAGLIDAIPGCRIASLDAPRLWNTVLIILPFGESQRWVTKLDKRGWEVSTTAACAAAAGHGSATLLSMGATAAESRRALRFSAGWGTSQADWNGLLEALREVAEEMRQGPVISA